MHSARRLGASSNAVRALVDLNDTLKVENVLSRDFKHRLNLRQRFCRAYGCYIRSGTSDNSIGWCVWSVKFEKLLRALEKVSRNEKREHELSQQTRARLKLGPPQFNAPPLVPGFPPTGQLPLFDTTNFGPTASSFAMPPPPPPTQAHPFMSTEGLGAARTRLHSAHAVGLSGEGLYHIKFVPNILGAKKAVTQLLPDISKPTTGSEFIADLAAEALESINSSWTKTAFEFSKGQPLILDDIELRFKNTALATGTISKNVASFFRYYNSDSNKGMYFRDTDRSNKSKAAKVTQSIELTVAILLPIFQARIEPESIFRALIRSDCIHSCLFYWIWPPIVQQALDQFVQYWNCHRIRVQAKKANPSGETPNHVYAAPLSLGLRNCLIKVQPDVVQNIRAQQVLTRDQALSFCSASFDAAARAVHQALGSPVITKFNAWEVFWQMLPLLRQLYGDLIPEKATVFTL